MRKMIDFIGAPHSEVLLWQIGYQAGKLYMGPLKNPYTVMVDGKPTHTPDSIQWEDGRRLAVTEYALKHKKAPPVWARDKMPRPIRHAV